MKFTRMGLGFGCKTHKKYIYFCFNSLHPRIELKFATRDIDYLFQLDPKIRPTHSPGSKKA